MAIQVPLLVFRRYAIKRIRHIGSHILVPVLIQGQAARGVLHEEMQYADFVVLQFGQLRDDFIGYEIAAARPCREREGFLEPGHAGLCVGNAARRTVGNRRCLRGVCARTEERKWEGDQIVWEAWKEANEEENEKSPGQCMRLRD
jgi:hypothetical protein